MFKFIFFLQPYLLKVISGLTQNDKGIYTNP